ncbi:hypothetical protein CR513_22959, partial [Mucuna pruriens]
MDLYPMDKRGRFDFWLMGSSYHEGFWGGNYGAMRLLSMPMLKKGTHVLKRGEDLHKHLKGFRVVYSTMRSHGIPEDYIKMKTFPFSLDGAAKDKSYYNQYCLIHGKT